MDTYVILRRNGWPSGDHLQEAAARSTQVGDEEMSDDEMPGVDEDLGLPVDDLITDPPPGEPK